MGLFEYLLFCLLILSNSNLSQHIFFSKMQATQNLRKSYWDAFLTVYSNYSPNELPIENKSFGEIVTDFLNAVTPMDREHSMKNMFRLDTQAKGFIHFDQLGNFFLRHHCAQLTLYKWHKKNEKQGHKNGKKMSLDQFSAVLSKCFTFLNITVPNQVAVYIFNENKSLNGFITYVEYFSIFEKYFCRKFSVQTVKFQDTFSGLKKSRVINHVWKNLQRLFDAYVQGRQLEATDEQLTKLISLIVQDKSESDMQFLLINFLKVEDSTIQLETFGKHLFTFIGELGVSEYALNTQATNRVLSAEKEYFYCNNGKFVGVYQFARAYHDQIFMAIDLDQNGVITYEEYVQYFRGFLGYQKYYGQRYFVKTDDMDVVHQVPIYSCPPDPSQPRINSVQFKFASSQFGVEVRQRIYDIASKYDIDQDQEFNKSEVQAVYTHLLQQSGDFDEFYRNALKYDREGDQCLSYDQLVDFLIEYHCGELVYAKLQSVTLSKNEFSELFNRAFGVFGVSASEETTNTLFDQIDINKDGSIPSVTFLLFLKHYLGAWSAARLETLNYREGKGVKPSHQSVLASLQGLGPVQKFSKTIVGQLRQIFFNYDKDKSLTFELHQVKEILQKVFSLQDNDVNYILFNFFNFGANNSGVTFENLISIVLLNYFVGILLKNKYQNQADSAVWKEKRLQRDDFINLLADGCFFLKVKPSTETLAAVFESIDSDKKGFITFGEYTAFIKKTLAEGIDIAAINAAKTKDPQASQEETEFSKRLRAKLQQYFEHYDKGSKGSLTQEELLLFVQQVLHTYSRRNIDSLFWNLFLVDQTPNRVIPFSQFAPLIINNSAEVALHQHLHTKPKGTNGIQLDEIHSLVRNSFSFLQTIAKEVRVVDKALQRIKIVNNSIESEAYLNWVHTTLSLV